jgi:hypothetical protein
LKRSFVILQHQIADVEVEKTLLTAEESALESSNLPNQLHERSGIKIRLLTLDATLVYLRALAEQRRPWEHAP